MLANSRSAIFLFFFFFKPFDFVRHVHSDDASFLRNTTQRGCLSTVRHRCSASRRVETATTIAKSICIIRLKVCWSVTSGENGAGRGGGRRVRGCRTEASGPVWSSMLSNNPFSSTSTAYTTTSPRRRRRPRYLPPPFLHRREHPLPREPTNSNPFIILLYTSLSHRSLCNPLSSLATSLFSRHPPPPWLFYTPHAQTLPPTPPPQCILFSPLFFPFASSSPLPYSLFLAPPLQPGRNATLNPRFT